MKIRKELVVLLVVLSLLISGCATGGTTNPPATLQPPVAPSPAPIPLPKITLIKGDFYFKIDGKPGFIFSRNLSGNKPDDWAVLAAQAHQRGDLVVRVGAENSFMGGYYGYGHTSNGEVREDWSKNWEKFLDISDDNGIYVFPFFSGWINWDPNYLSGWAHNPFNSVNGGPAKDSSELFKKDSPTQLLFLKWFKDVVMRWSKHDNILAWEPIGEVNLFNGVTEKSAIYFIEQLAKIVRENDPLKRPVTFSLAGNLNEWPNFYRNDAIDFINIHPYPSSGQLDRGILADAHGILDKYQKPVMIGESGLSSDSPDRNPPTFTTSARAIVGIEHAIWMAMVSGVMNGRALWYEDSYALYFPALSWSFLNKYMDAEVPAVRFIKGVDYTNFKPLAVQTSLTITGGVIGSEKFVIGWFRDASCEPPDWNMKPLISKQNVTITVPGVNVNWQVDFYNTKTGTEVIKSITSTRKGNNITINLPDFTDDIAFKMYPTNKSATTAEPTNAVTSSTDLIAGKWSGTITSDTSGFSTPIVLSIKPNCKAGTVCGTVSVPKLPCSGNLFLKEIQGDVFVFIEQKMKGSSACSSGGLESLQLQADGTLSLKFTSTSAQGVTLSSSGILKK